MIEYKIEELTGDIYLETSGLLETLRDFKKYPDIPNLRKEDVVEAIERMKSQDSKTYVAINSKNEIIGTSKILIEQKLIRGLGLVGHIEDVVTRRGYEKKGV